MPVVVPALALFVWACDPDALGAGVGDPNIYLDARVRLEPDARSPDRTTPDAGGDAAVSGEDAAAADTSTPDAAAPACPCPQLPSTCAPAARDLPAFSAADPPGAMLEQLFAVIACADTTLQIAMYESEWDCIASALAARLGQDPDVTIELVVDDDQCPRSANGLDCALNVIDGRARVTIVDDARSRYMHHKFVIADGAEVWAGSGNFTRSSFCSEENNAIVIGQPVIVAGYQAEFTRMFTAREFGPAAARTPIESAPYHLYFSPESPISSGPAWFDELISSVESAAVSVDFMIFALTRHEVATALIAAKQRGVRVRGVIAPEFRSEPAIESLLTAQLDLRVGPVHSKVMIVDGARVITGSPNWSENAWGNNEASLWIESSTIAALYAVELERVFAAGSPP